MLTSFSEAPQRIVRTVKLTVLPSFNFVLVFVRRSNGLIQQARASETLPLRRWLRCSGYMATREMVYGSSVVGRSTFAFTRSVNFFT